jgi:hypothetical protein
MAGIPEKAVDCWSSCTPWPRCERAMLSLRLDIWNHQTYCGLLSIHKGSLASHLPSPRWTPSIHFANNSSFLDKVTIVVDRAEAERAGLPLRAHQDLKGTERSMLPGSLHHSDPVDAGDQGRSENLDPGGGLWPGVLGNTGIEPRLIVLVVRLKM